MLDIQENVDIKDYSTLGVGGVFRYFVCIKSTEDLREAFLFIKEKKLKVFILGGGSNTVFPDDTFEVIALKINILGFEILKENEKYIDIKVGAGENWDKFVERVVGMNLSGVEALSLIPGTVGATPVQNVGAYGQEVKDTILSVDVFDKESGVLKTFTNEECKFAYRDSIFKNDAPMGVKGKYIILNVIFRLFKTKLSIPNYPDVKEYFLEKDVSNPSILDIRNAIVEIRQRKLPNPTKTPNVGSFFKNPIVEKTKALDLKDKYQSLKIFELKDNPEMVKLSAGWLIENAGLKGKDFGNVRVYENNALVLVNNGGATRLDIDIAKNEIIKIVYQKFGITLEHEPEMI